MNHDLFAALVDQVETAALAGGGLSNLSRWICQQTRHPQNPHVPFSLQGHEFQREIMDCARPHVVTRKCTQIGLSELSIRSAVAVTAKFTGISTMYVLPSIRFAQKFAMSRVDPVINNSPRLKALVNPAVFSNELKQIGSSFLYLSGAASTSSGISVPARALYIDEYEWADPNVVSIYISRQGHQTKEDKILRHFSSPLYPGSGISALFEGGDQRQYMCYHAACGQWVVLDPLQDMIIPGYDDLIGNLSYLDLDQPGVRTAEAYIQCPHCHDPVSVENMANPALRAWVPAYPDREVASFDCNPLVLPQLRTCQALLDDLRLYRNTVKWVQFSLGKPAESASDMITQAALSAAFQSRLVPVLAADSVQGATVGMDVGKTSHIVVGKKVGRRFEVVWLETVRQTEDNATGTRLVELFDKYHAVQAVLDAGPDISLPKYVRGQLPYGQGWGCYFIRGRGKANLLAWETDELNGTVKVNRNRALDEFVEAFNRGLIWLPPGTRYDEELRHHLQQMKRVAQLDGAGEEAVQWVASTPATHFFFALFYAWLGSQLAEASTGMVPGLQLGRMIGKVRLAA